jgi:hypothetical protein
MKFVTYPFRHADVILQQPEFKKHYDEIIEIITSVSDDEIIQKFNKRSGKSISVAINQLLKQRFAKAGWATESNIFQDEKYSDKSWFLDFAGNDISIEVAFNHGEAIAWNLIKPVLASELNHVKKNIQTTIGIIICATAEMKKAGGFDSAVGEFEKICRYLVPLRSILTVPILVIGLSKPESFKIKLEKVNGKNIGEVIRF